MIPRLARFVEATAHPILSLIAAGTNVAIVKEFLARANAAFINDNHQEPASVASSFLEGNVTSRQPV